MNARPILAASLVTFATAARPASPADRVRIVLNGVWSGAPAGWSETRSYTEFAETGRLSASYTPKAAFGPDVGAQVTLFRKLGVYLAVSSATRDEPGTLQAELPHPLYLNRPRSASVDLTGYRFDENALHANLVVGGAGGRIDYALFAGVSSFNVEAHLVERVSYNHTYPYDSVTLSQPPSKRVQDRPVGFNLGGRIDYRFGSARRFGFGVQLRFSRATAKLKATDTNTISVDAGGLLAGGGIRLYF